jgi:hypothetical protein
MLLQLRPPLLLWLTPAARWPVGRGCVVLLPWLALPGLRLLLSLCLLLPRLLQRRLWLVTGGVWLLQAYRCAGRCAPRPDHGRLPRHHQSQQRSRRGGRSWRGDHRQRQAACGHAHCVCEATTFMTRRLLLRLASYEKHANGAQQQLAICCGGSCAASHGQTDVRATTDAPQNDKFSGTIYVAVASMLAQLMALALARNVVTPAAQGCCEQCTIATSSDHTCAPHNTHTPTHQLTPHTKHTCALGDLIRCAVWALM